MFPFEAKSPPTGSVVVSKESDLFVVYCEVYKDISAFNLGDNSIKSKVLLGPYIVSTTTLKPFINLISLNVVIPFVVKYFGSVRSFIKPILLVSSVSNNENPYSGVLSSQSSEFQVYKDPTSWLDEPIMYDSPMVVALGSCVLALR